MARLPFPADGATQVPTNARVVVRYLRGEGGSGFERADGGLGAAEVQLRVRGGAVVAAERTVVGNSFVLRPLAPLAPLSVYEIVDRIQAVPCLGRTDQPARLCAITTDPKAFATFMTGVGVDLSPPRFGGLVALTSAAVLDVCDSGACCGPYVRRGFSLTWDAATDDVAGVSVLYRVLGPPDAPSDLVDGTSLALTAGCQHPNRPSFEPGSLDGRYGIRAIDWAGNEDENTVTKEFAVNCPSKPTPATPAELDPDAGPVEAGTRDAAPALSDGPSPRRADEQTPGSCSFLPACPAHLGAPVLCALFAFGRLIARAARRRSKRSRPS